MPCCAAIQIQSVSGQGDIDYLAPIIADAEAGFGGNLNAFELMKSMIEAVPQVYTTKTSCPVPKSVATLAVKCSYPPQKPSTNSSPPVWLPTFAACLPYFARTDAKPPTCSPTTWIAPGSVTGAAWVMKGILLLADVAAVFFLYRLLLHWKQPVANVLWYALNPLCIIECVGNLHFEGLMVACLLAALYALVRGYYFGAAVAFALSIATKLLPLLFLPFCIRRMGIAKSFVWLGWIGIISVALWWPIVSGAFLENFTQSIALYVRQFEFNASFYYVIREIGYSWKGYNIIRLVGPWLWGTVTIIIFLRALLERSRRWEDIPEVWLFAISTFLFFATTVHPWYALLPLVLSTLTPWRWPVLWTALIPLSYLTYAHPSFQENLGWTAVEYGAVLLFGGWEWQQRRLKKIAVL
ncbi:MAG: hypothetical protein R2795_06795 [Saprospiraceae bacterium]